MTRKSRFIVRHPSCADFLLLLVRREAITRRAGSVRALAAIATARAEGRAS